MTKQGPNPEQVRAALERVVASPGFAEAGRLPTFLKYLVETELAGERDRLKESVLGVEVFQRDAGFDPRTDPIVRVEARRLRSRLEEYYAGSGKDDEVRLLLPKGGYVPVFETARPADAPSKQAEALTPMPKGWRLAAIIAGLAAAGILLGYLQSTYMKKIRQAPAATVAVMPFANVGGDPENEYFSDGLTEEIIDRLGRVPGLKVVGRSVMAQFRGKNASLDEIASRLGASVVVEGSVRRQGERLRVVARLAKASDGSSLWSQTYDRRMKDVFAIQDEIAQSVANALRVQVRGEGAASPPRRTTQNIEAYNLYLRGRQQANLYSADGMRRAIGYYQEALKLDPEFAPAQAGLSTSYSIAGYYWLLPAAEAWPNARAAAQRAIALDPTLGDAYASLGLGLAFYEWNWSEAEASLRKAIEVDDSSAIAHGVYAGTVLLPELRLDEADREFKKALELDPVLSFVNFTYAFALQAAGRYEDSIQQYKRTIELKGIHPDMYWDYGMALGFAKRYGEAREAMRKSRQERGEKSLELRGLEAFFAGDVNTARRDAPLVEKAAIEGREQKMDTARLWAMLGEKDKALEWIGKAIDVREPQAIWVLADPRFRSLRGDPRHDALVRRVGLVPHKRAD